MQTRADYGGRADPFAAAPTAPVFQMEAPIPVTRRIYPTQPWREYPKAALKRATKDDVDASLAIHENFDERRQKVYYTQKPPEHRTDERRRIQPALIPLLDPETGQPVIFENREEEEAFYAMYSDIERIDPSSDTGNRVSVDDKEYREFLAWKAARAQGQQEAGLFASTNEERVELMKRADAIPGFKIDKRWNHQRLRDEVIKAENDRKTGNDRPATNALMTAGDPDNGIPHGLQR